MEPLSDLLLFCARALWGCLANGVFCLVRVIHGGDAIAARIGAMVRWQLRQDHVQRLHIILRLIPTEAMLQIPIRRKKRCCAVRVVKTPEVVQAARASNGRYSTHASSRIPKLRQLRLPVTLILRTIERVRATSPAMDDKMHCQQRDGLSQL